MDWARGRIFVRFTTGLSGNKVLMDKITKQRKRAENDFKKIKKPVRRYFKFDYKAASWKYTQCVVVNIEVSSKGTNIRFVVTSNRNYELNRLNLS